MHTRASKLALLRLIPWALLPLALWGCAVAPSECDPAKGDASLYVKAHCLYSGEYQRRQDVRQDDLEEALRLKQVFQETLQTLQQEQARISSEKNAGQANLDNVSRSVSTLNAALQTRARNDAHLKTQISDLQQEMDKIQQLPGHTPLQQRQALSDLMVKVTDLQQSLELR